MVFVDSNVWCYYFDRSAPEHEPVAESLEAVLESEEELHVNTVVLMEVGHFLIKNLGGDEGHEKLRRLMNCPMTVDEVTYSLMSHSLEILSEEHDAGIGGRDATIVASMRNEDVEELMTHDQAFKKLDGFEVVDPV